MSNLRDEYVLVVGAAEPAVANESFEEWLRDSGIDKSTLTGDDVLQDILRGMDKRTKFQYWVRKDVLLRLGIDPPGA